MTRPTTASRLFLMSALLVSLSGLNLVAGCGEETPTVPGDTSAEVPPVLPDATALGIDLGFFGDGAEAGKSLGRQNFFNAYLRAVIVTAVTDLVLVPPVAAFSLALHTPPSRQPDGAWLWVYTFVDGDEEAQIRLRGRVDGALVHWEMRVTLDDGRHELDRALWFDGTTGDDGRTGLWTFYDLDLPGHPAAGELAWSHEPARHVLSLTALRGDPAGDSLTFLVDGPALRIDYVDGDTAAAWFIRWNDADGTGSLMVPDYNLGEEACWDARQYDVDCGS